MAQPRFDSIERSLWRIETMLNVLLGVTLAYGQKEQEMFDELIAAVEEQKTVVDSVETLLNELAAKLQAALAASGVTPEQAAKLQAALEGVKANSGKLAEAVAAHTVADDEAHAAGM